MTPETPEARITYVGHATVLIEMDGVRILTDPLFRKFIGPIRRQVPVPPLDDKPIDAVLISHLHGDHLDLPSLRRLGPDTELIVPRGTARYLTMRRFGQVSELDEGESTAVGPVVITATRAEHGGRQMPFRPLVHSLGFVIDGAHEIYFAGDTDLFPEMDSIGVALDLALLPVWGWGPTLGPGHMDPLRAAQALARLRPRLAIPVHWGTYCPIFLDRLSPAFLTRPPLDFAGHAAELAPEVSVHILQPGQPFWLR